MTLIFEPCDPLYAIVWNWAPGMVIGGKTIVSVEFETFNAPTGELVRRIIVTWGP